MSSTFLTGMCVRLKTVGVYVQCSEHFYVREMRYDMVEEFAYTKGRAVEESPAELEMQRAHQGIHIQSVAFWDFQSNVHIYCTRFHIMRRHPPGRGHVWNILKSTSLSIRTSSPVGLCVCVCLSFRWGKRA